MAISIIDLIATLSINDTSINMLIVTCYAECHYAESGIFIVMLSQAFFMHMLDVIVPSTVMLSLAFHYCYAECRGAHLGCYGLLS